MRVATSLHQAGSAGVGVDALVGVAGFGGGADPTSQLNRELRHLRTLGWQIDNINEPGLPAVYRMSSVDNRLRLKLTPGQQAALRRAAIVADRADLVERLGLPADIAASEIPTTVPQPEHDPELAIAIRAVRHNAVLRFRYNGQVRVVHPQSVLAQNATWYLRGREEGITRDKVFVVSRMLEVSAEAPGTATPAPDPKHTGLHPMSWEVDPPTEVVLAAPTEFAPDVRRWLGAAASELDRDGNTTFTYRVTHRAALRSRIYHLGTRVRVIGPGWVRDEILADLTLMAGV